MIVNNTRRILEKYDINAKKAYGQNFLIKEHVIDEIIYHSEINNKTCVVEIGPGIGALTEALARKAKKVLAYEIDKKMVEVLEDTLNKYSNVIIKNIDFLKVNLQEDLKEYFDGCEEIRVIANLPYYITTPIIFKLLESSGINNIIIMVQKEVGKRLTGKPNTKDYNALSVLMQYKTISKIIGNVSRNCFYPEPNVDSVLLNIITKKSDYGVDNEHKFLEFIQAIFLQRRKTIVNNISKYYIIEKDIIVNKLIEYGMREDLRAEALNIYEIVKLYKGLFE